MFLIPRSCVPTLLTLLLCVLPGPLVATEQAMLPEGCAASEYRQFDFRIGSFEVTAGNGQRAGESNVQSILGGCLLEEHWKGAVSGQGRAQMYYDGHRRLWHLDFVNDEGETLRLNGRFTGPRLELTGDNVFYAFAGLHRMVWTLLPDGNVSQAWDLSTDGGESWTQVFRGTYARQPGNLPPVDAE